MADTSNPDNGRVTLALLGQKIDALTEQVGELHADMRTVSSWCTESKTRWVQHDKDHAALGTRRDVGDAIVGAIAIIGAALGIAIKQP